MKTTKHSKHHEFETSSYHYLYDAIEQFLAKGKMTEPLDYYFYDLETSNPIIERNTQNACLALIFWICFMQDSRIDRYARDDYFGLFEMCYDISKDNSKLPICPFYAKETKSMTKEKEKAAIDFINKFMYKDGVNRTAFFSCYAMELQEIINGHSLLDIYKGLTRYANELSNSLYNSISNPCKELLIALGRDANGSIDYSENEAFAKILACKPKWKKMIESMSDDEDHLMVLGRLVWMRRMAYHSDYKPEIAIHYWMYACNKEEMHQLDDEFGYVAEKEEEEKTIISQQYKKKFIQAIPIWEEFVKEGYLEGEGRVYRWLNGNNRQFGYFIHYAHKYLYRWKAEEVRIDWEACCKLFTMPFSASRSYCNAHSLINTFEKNKRDGSKKCPKLPPSAKKIEKIFKYMKRPSCLK